jgi:hypothetical protein
MGKTPNVILSLILCVLFQLAPGDDAMLSHTYSLLNYIAATSRFSGVDDMVKSFRGQMDKLTTPPSTPWSPL